MSRQPGAASYRGVSELLDAARAGLTRLSPEQAVEAVAAGALIVDIRPAWQRSVEGEIAGSVIVERNHLEWRLDPGSAARLDCALPGQQWVVACSEGYTSSLAAASLNSIGVPASDLAGGVTAWREAGLPLVSGPSRTERVVGPGSLLDFGDLGSPHVEDEAPH